MYKYLDDLARPSLTTRGASSGEAPPWPRWVPPREYRTCCAPGPAASSPAAPPRRRRRPSRPSGARGRRRRRTPKSADADGSGAPFARGSTSRSGRIPTARSWTSRSSVRARTSQPRPHPRPRRPIPTLNPSNPSSCRPPKCTSPREPTFACERSSGCGTTATGPTSPCSTATTRKHRSRSRRSRWAPSESTTSCHVSSRRLASRK